MTDPPVEPEGDLVEAHEQTAGRSMASVGIWFETILMEMLIRHYYDQDPTSRHAQYALIEVADECRHSVMFGRMIERLGCPVYRVTGVDRWLGRWLKATAT